MLHIQSLQPGLVICTHESNLCPFCKAEEEIKVLMAQATETGLFERVEQDMVERVFRLGDLTVDALLTPRTELFWLDLTDSAEIVRAKMMAQRQSRYPVVEGTIDRLLKGLGY